jgi:hypothetical protein
MTPTVEHEHVALPHRIELVREHTGVQRLVIDGKPFPYPFAVDFDHAPQVHLRAGYPPAVTLTLIAENLTVSDTAEREPEPTDREPVEVRTPADLREPLP